MEQEVKSEFIEAKKNKTHIGEMLITFFCFVCMAVAWYSATFNIPWYIVYVMQSIIAVLAIIVLGVTGNTNDARRPVLAAFYYMIGYAVMLIITSLINVYQINALRVITRGFSDILYQFIAIAFVCGIVYLFKYKALYLVYYSMLASYFFLFFKVCMQYGIVSTLTDIKNVILLGADNTPASAALEVHDLTFAFGAFLCYFILNFRQEKHSLINIIIAVIAIFLGYKRFIFPAVLMCVVFYHILNFLRRKLGRRLTFKILILIQSLFLVGFFVYIIVIRSGLFEYLTNRFEINTMGRTTLYNAIKDYYIISPSYVGKGLGWINRNLKLITGHVTGTEGLHCNVLEFYIELGFWGFLIFFGYQLVIQTVFLYKRFSIKAAIWYAVMYMYCGLTYLTDNTVFYRGINGAVRVIVMAFIVLEYERGKTQWNRTIKRSDTK